MERTLLTVDRRQKEIQLIQNRKEGIHIEWETRTKASSDLVRWNRMVDRLALMYNLAPDQDAKLIYSSFAVGFWFNAPGDEADWRGELWIADDEILHNGELHLFTWETCGWFPTNFYASATFVLRRIKSAEISKTRFSDVMYMQEEILRVEGLGFSRATLNPIHLIERALTVVDGWGISEEQPMLVEEANKILEEDRREEDDKRIDDDVFHTRVGHIWDDLRGWMERIAPRGYYFGSTEGDGSDIGWWKEPPDEYEEPDVLQENFATHRIMWCLRCGRPQNEFALAPSERVFQWVGDEYLEVSDQEVDEDPVPMCVHCESPLHDN